MKQLYIIFLLMVSGCTSGPAYQADRPVEDRDTYQGLQGVGQFMKDQNTLADKELTEKCVDAELDMAVAQSSLDNEMYQEAKARHSRVCRK